MRLKLLNLISECLMAISLYTLSTISFKFLLRYMKFWLFVQGSINNRCCVAVLSRHASPRCLAVCSETAWPLRSGLYHGADLQIRSPHNVRSVSLTEGEAFILEF